jgi:hypothetical protein
VIACESCIVQDQLVKSSNSGKVNVIYPRGSQTWLGVRIDSHPPELILFPAGADGAETQWTVVGGNLVNLGDRPTCEGAKVLGDGLVMPL